jgi:siroheme synthase
MVTGRLAGARVCLVTSGQPASNPRLVKEADALVEAGCTVHVVGAHWADWATRYDAQLPTGRGWTYTFVDWRRETMPMRYWQTGARQRLAQAALDWPGLSRWTVAAPLSRAKP